MRAISKLATHRGIRRRAACLLVLALFALAKSANAGVRDNVYSFGLDTLNIYQVNYPNGTVTSLFANYPTAGGAATAAAGQRPSDGVIIYIANYANQPVFTWNPATPATAPVQIGTTGAGIPYIPRAAFSPHSAIPIYSCLLLAVET